MKKSYKEIYLEKWKIKWELQLNVSQRIILDYKFGFSDMCWTENIYDTKDRQCVTKRNSEKNTSVIIKQEK